MTTDKYKNLGKVLVILPAYNEEKSLPFVVSTVKEKAPYADIAIVNDCSKDQTLKVAKSLNVPVLNLPINLGVGGAMRTGFVYAVRNKYDWAVQVDSDGQHDPEYIIEMLNKALDENLDIVIGARFAGVGDYKAKGLRWLAMQFLAKVLSLQIGVKLTDVTSGFKLYSAKALKFYEKTYPAEYLGDTIEALGLAHKAGLKIGQIPVAMSKRVAGVPSHSPIKSAIFLFRAVLALFVAVISPKTEID